MLHRSWLVQKQFSDNFRGIFGFIMLCLGPFSSSFFKKLIYMSFVYIYWILTLCFYAISGLANVCASTSIGVS